MEQLPSCSVSQEISNIFIESRVYCRVHNSPLFVPIQTQMNPVNSFPSCAFKINLNLILPLHLVRRLNYIYVGTLFVQFSNSLPETTQSVPVSPA
jgi:hypothetical protein